MCFLAVEDTDVLCSVTCWKRNPVPLLASSFFSTPPRLVFHPVLPHMVQFRYWPNQRHRTWILLIVFSEGATCVLLSTPRSTAGLRWCRGVDSRTKHIFVLTCFRGPHTKHPCLPRPKNKSAPSHPLSFFVLAPGTSHQAPGHEVNTGCKKTSTCLTRWKYHPSMNKKHYQTTTDLCSSSMKQFGQRLFSANPLVSSVRRDVQRQKTIKMAAQLT